MRSTNLRRHRRQQGGRRSSSTPSSWRAQPQASPTRPEQPSLASPSVGGGMGPLVPRSRTLERPTLGPVRSFSTISNVNVHMTHATSHPYSFFFQPLLLAHRGGQPFTRANRSRANRSRANCSRDNCSRDNRSGCSAKTVGAENRSVHRERGASESWPPTNEPPEPL